MSIYNKSLIDNAFALNVALGKVDGYSVVHKFGSNPTVPNGSWAGILSAAAQFVWPQTPIAVRVKAGGNAADVDTTGAGARTVTVQGLDSTGVQVQATISLLGATVSAPTTQTFLRVYRVWVETAGTYTGANTGAILIETTAGTALINIAAGAGQSQYCAYTIPLGKTGLLTMAEVQVDGTKASDFRLFTRANILDVAVPVSPKRLKLYWDGVLGTDIHQPNFPELVLPALTDIWIEARGGGALTEATANMEIVLVDD